MDTLTLSIEQKTLAEERIKALGLQDKVRVHLMDYRDIPSTWAGRFDAFVSVEMLEVRFPPLSLPPPSIKLTRPLYLACGD